MSRHGEALAPALALALALASALHKNKKKSEVALVQALEMALVAALASALAWAPPKKRPHIHIESLAAAPAVAGRDGTYPRVHGMCIGTHTNMYVYNTSTYTRRASSTVPKLLGYKRPSPPRAVCSSNWAGRYYPLPRLADLGNRSCNPAVAGAAKQESQESSSSLSSLSSSSSSAEESADAATTTPNLADAYAAPPLRRQRLLQPQLLVAEAFDPACFLPPREGEGWQRSNSLQRQAKAKSSYASFIVKAQPGTKTTNGLEQF